MIQRGPFAKKLSDAGKHGLPFFNALTFLISINIKSFGDG